MNETTPSRPDRSPLFPAELVIVDHRYVVRKRIGGVIFGVEGLTTWLRRKKGKVGAQ